MSHEKFRSCIDHCYECAMICDHCATACLNEKDPGKMKLCIELDLYCSDLCRLAASFMARGDRFAAQICSLCADVCDACGKECAKHEPEHCRQCAEVCAQCAVECRKMAA